MVREERGRGQSAQSRDKIPAADGQVTCSNSEYYNKTLKECCAICPSGSEKRHPCIKNPAKDCKNPCAKGYFINWEQSTPHCTPCAGCLQGDDLTETRPCSTNSDTVCKCLPGLYCETSVMSTCARCSPHSKCYPGFRVKHAGNESHDTVCEERPLEPHTDVHSATEGWKPHTQIPLYQTVQHSAIRANNKSPNKVVPTSHRALTILLHPRSTTGGRVMATSKPDSISTFTTVTDPGGTGELKPWYVAVGITGLVFLLLVTLILVMKRKIWTVKPLLVNRKGFTSYNFPPKRKPALFTYTEKGTGDGLLNRENLPMDQQLLGKGENNDCEHLLHENAEKRDRDHLTNRIEKIYIMKADTVLVGSISEAPNRQVTVRAGSERHSPKCGRDPVFASRYPEQESSDAPRSDLMFSVEEEGKTKGVTSSLCV